MIHWLWLIPFTTLGAVVGWVARGWLEERRAYRRPTFRATRWDADYGIWMDTARERNHD